MVRKNLYDLIQPLTLFHFGAVLFLVLTRMNNGNTFINEGAKGRFFEVTKEGKIVWEYLNPYRGEIRKPNGDLNSPMPMTFSTFRSTFIPADHPGLANRKLEPLNPQPKPFVMPPLPSGDK